MAGRKNHLKLDDDSAFDKSRLKRLRQDDEAWEVDFRPLPKPLSQSSTHYLGMVVTLPGGVLLADQQIEGRPSVNDLATLLANAMRQPQSGKAHRPSRILLRGHRQWKEIFPHLDELGIEVVVRTNLPQFEEVYKGYLRQLRDEQRKTMVRPSAEQLAVEKLFPSVARWVQDGGHIEIGDQEMFGFVARALDHGGLIFEDEKAETLAEAMAALDKALAEWFEVNE